MEYFMYIILKVGSIPAINQLQTILVPCFAHASILIAIKQKAH
jgi:hypothetical protein